MGILSLATKNLTRRRGRTLLTIMGVAVAVAFTVGILSISEGFMLSFKQSLYKQGADIFVFPKQAEIFPYIPGLGAMGETFPEKYLSKIQKVENVRSAHPLLEVPLVLNKKVPLNLNGVTPAFLAEVKPFLRPRQGELLKSNDNNVLLIGSRVAQIQQLKLGSEIDVHGKSFKVTGILETSGGMDDGMLYALLKTVQEAYAQKGEISGAAIKVKEVDKVEKTVKEIKKVAPKVSAQSVSETVEKMMDLLGMARAIHLSVASIALLIGVLFVFSTMLMAVSERVREIGTMRAIGTSRRSIFKLIVIESIIISLIAGILGCFGGYLLSRAITFGISEAMGMAYFEALVTLRIFSFGLLIALFVGGLAGLYPAWKISKVTIAEALQYE